MDKTTLTDRSTWWRRWLVAPVVDQLTRGISPHQISWAISFGVVLGIFPVMGTTTVLCLFFGWIFRLNQPLLQLFKALVYPLHLSMILVFIHAGDRLYGVAPISYSLRELLNRFRINPLQFSIDFGVSALHGISAWILIAPFAVLLIRWITLPILNRFSLVIRKRKEAAK